LGHRGESSGYRQTSHHKCVQDFQHWWKEQKQANKHITKVMFQGIDLPRTYGNAEQWNFSKIKTPYDIHFPTLIQIMYKRDKVYYFSNKNVISIIIKVQGKFVDWANTMFK
jgi:hypothetical protein